MPTSHPCTTRECQEAALAALKAEKTALSPCSGPADTEAKAAGNGNPPGGRGSASAARAGEEALSPPGTPATGRPVGAEGTGFPATPAGITTSREAVAGRREGSGGTSMSSPPPSAKVRFSDETEAARDNLHVGLGLQSRSSSSDSLHRAYDEAAAGNKPPPAASGFHVMHTAGGRLEAVSSSARWEDVVGYSRAVKRGPFVYVSGTCAVDQATGRVMYRRDAYKQTRLAFTIIERALAQVGADIEDVVRTRVFVRNLQRDGEAISRAHGEVLGHVKPASTMVEVVRCVHEDILCLIEVDAIVGDGL